MNVYSLVDRLKSLGQVEVGYGPRHPDSPNTTIANDVGAFLKEYPFLRRDQGYVDFLEYYAGIRIEREEDDLILDIFGFTDVSSHIRDLEGPIVDENGFLTFCDGTVRFDEKRELESVNALSFSFDATQSRRWGIYYTGKRDSKWYCATFAEWLQSVIDTKGKLSL